jgi:hypothetical protein
MPWTYDPRLRGSGYRDLDTGRILSNDEVRGLVDISIDAGEDVTGTLAGLVANDQLSAADWEERMREEIKDQYIAQYLSGAGGRDQMDSVDWGSVGGMIADQYRFLDDFADDVETGDLSEAQIAARSEMYINSSREAYERALLRSSPEHGWTEKAWGLSEVENCEDCIFLSSLGFIPVTEPFVAPSTGKEAIPGGGNTICLTNCQCGTEYR